MGYRGRLIFPLSADIYRLDLAGTAADPDGAGPLTGGYDPIYREPYKLPSNDRLGTSARKELSVVNLPAQIEPATMQRLQMMAAGDASQSRIVFVFHFEDLDAAALVNQTTGAPLIAKGDRLGAIRKTDGTLIQSIPNPPGLFVTEALSSFGLDGDRNLLLVTFESRDPG